MDNGCSQSAARLIGSTVQLGGKYQLLVVGLPSAGCQQVTMLDEVYTGGAARLLGVIFGVLDAVVSIASQHSDKQAISKQGRLSV